jgi:hypothetical protein
MRTLTILVTLPKLFCCARMSTSHAFVGLKVRTIKDHRMQNIKKPKKKSSKAAQHKLEIADPDERTSWRWGPPPGPGCQWSWSWSQRSLRRLSETSADSAGLWASPEASVAKFRSSMWELTEDNMQTNKQTNKQADSVPASAWVQCHCQAPVRGWSRTACRAAAAAQGGSRATSWSG